MMLRKNECKMFVSELSPDVSHVSEVLVEVQGVADHELVRDLKGNVVRGITVTLKKGSNSVSI